MKTIGLFLLGLFLIPTSLGAQAVHPCDETPPTVFRYPSAQVSVLAVGWCFKPEDTNGFPITDPIGFKVEIEGVGIADVGVVEPAIPESNSLGYFFYFVRVPNLAAGNIHIHAYTSSGESAASDPFTLTLLGPPKKPVKGQVQKIP